MRVLDLFSGIGGFSLGLERAGMETVAFCEIDPFCQKVLKKHWPDVPIFDDVRNLDYDGSVDLICGGFPCQPFSVAGQQKGKQDDRHLWPAMFGLIQKYKPRWVIGENVAGFINMALDDVLADLEGAGYGVQCFVIPACATGVHHRRDRVWIMAHAECDGQFTPAQPIRFEQTTPKQSQGQDGTLNIEGTSRIPEARKDVADTQSQRAGRCRNSDCAQGQEGCCNAQPDGCCSNVPDTNKQCSRTGNEPARRQEGADLDRRSARTDVANPTGERIQRHGTGGKQEPCPHEGAGLSLRSGEGRGSANWQVEPDVGRVVDGVPNRVDRIKSLGNAVVPQIVEILGNAIMEAEVQI